MNKRLELINNFVDKHIINDVLNNLLIKYENELDTYNYIETVDDFSVLTLRGSMKYINKYDKELRNGGLLIKIFKNNEEWIGVIKKSLDKKYYVKFSKNYIFYKENKNKLFKKSLQNLILQFQ